MTILNSKKKYNIFNARAHIQTALPRAQWITNRARHTIQCVHGWMHIPLNIRTPTSAWRRLASPSPLDQPRVWGEMVMAKSCPPICGRTHVPYIPSLLIHTFAVCSWHSPTERRRGGACLIFLDCGRDSGYDRNGKVPLFSAGVSSEPLSLVSKFGSVQKLQLTQQRDHCQVCLWRDWGLQATLSSTWLAGETSEDLHVQASWVSALRPQIPWSTHYPFSCARPDFLTHRFCEHSRINSIFRDIGQ